MKQVPNTALRSVREKFTGVDSPNFEAKPSIAWELVTGTVQLFISGPGEVSWLACSEPCYSGPVGTPEERSIARRAIAILNQDHRHDRMLAPAGIRAILERAASQPVAEEVIEEQADCQPETEPFAQLDFKVVPEETMRWKCIDCANSFQGPANRAPVGGCPLCGSSHVFDCNVEPVTAFLPRPPTPPMPARLIKGGARKLTPCVLDAGVVASVIEAVAKVTGVPALTILGRRRPSRFTKARFLAVASVRARFPGATLQHLGKAFSRDHAAIINCIERHETFLKCDEEYRQWCERLSA